MYTEAPLRTSDPSTIVNIISLLRQHRGEVRLLRLHWQLRPGRSPITATLPQQPLHNTTYKSRQLHHTDYLEADSSTRNTEYRLPTNRKHDSILSIVYNDLNHHHFQNNCTTWTLPTLFSDFGSRYTATTIYNYYISLPILTPPGHRHHSPLTRLLHR